MNSAILRYSPPDFGCLRVHEVVRTYGAAMRLGLPC